MYQQEKVFLEEERKSLLKTQQIFLQGGFSSCPISAGCFGPFYS